MTNSNPNDSLPKPKVYFDSLDFDGNVVQSPSGGGLRSPLNEFFKVMSPFTFNNESENEENTESQNNDFYVPYVPSPFIHTNQQEEQQQQNTVTRNNNTNDHSFVNQQQNVQSALSQNETSQNQRPQFRPFSSLSNVDQCVRELRHLTNSSPL